MLATTSMGDVLLDSLRREIVSGRLRPGESLRQDEIARSFGVSHVPVRETFIKLQAEGLVEIRPRRGAIVAALSAAEVEDLNDMRSALECCALRIAIPKIGDADLRKAAQVLDRIDRDRSRWADFNTDFHSILYKPAARPRLLGAILTLQRNLARYIHREVEVTNNFAESQRQHRKLLTLIKGARVAEACALLHDHIVEPGNVLVSELRKAGYQ